MISAAQLAAMQATANRIGDQSVAIYRATDTKSPTGADIRPAFPGGWTLVATVTGNSSQPTPTQLQNYGYAIAAVDARKVRVPVGTDIRIGDRVTVAGSTWEVQIELTPHSYQTSIEVIVAEARRQ